MQTVTNLRSLTRSEYESDYKPITLTEMAAYRRNETDEFKDPELDVRWAYITETTETLLNEGVIGSIFNAIIKVLQSIINFIVGIIKKVVGLFESLLGGGSSGGGGGGSSSGGGSSGGSGGSSSPSEDKKTKLKDLPKTNDDKKDDKKEEKEEQTYQVNSSLSDTELKEKHKDLTEDIKETTDRIGELTTEIQELVKENETAHDNGDDATVASTAKKLSRLSTEFDQLSVKAERFNERAKACEGELSKRRLEDEDEVQSDKSEIDRYMKLFKQWSDAHAKLSAYEARMNNEKGRFEYAKDKLEYYEITENKYSDIPNGVAKAMGLTPGELKAVEQIGKGTDKLWDEFSDALLNYKKDNFNSHDSEFNENHRSLLLKIDKNIFRHGHNMWIKLQTLIRIL